MDDYEAPSTNNAFDVIYEKLRLLKCVFKTTCMPSFLIASTDWINSTNTMATLRNSYENLTKAQVGLIPTGSPRSWKIFDSNKPTKTMQRIVVYIFLFSLHLSQI